MTNLPSSWVLRGLRRCVAGEGSAAQHASVGLFCKSGDTSFVNLLAACAGLRESFRAAVEIRDEKTAFDAFVGTWAIFATLSPDHPLHMRPLFRHGPIMDLLQSEVRMVMWLEMLKLGKGPGVAGMGHRALGGPHGVGKTYILRGLALVTSVLCTAVTPITWSYAAEGVADHELTAGSALDLEASSRSGMIPISVLLNSHELFDDCTSDAECSAALRARSAALGDADVPVVASAIAATDMAAAGAYPLLLLDDVHLLCRSDGLQERGDCLVTQLLHFGRHPHRIAVVAGSSACLREQMFGVDCWKGVHPSLNPVVFSLTEIAPVRDRDCLTAYLHDTRVALPEGLSVDGLLSLSGGLSRVIPAVVAGERKPCGRLDPLELFETDHAFRMLAFFMLENEAVAARLAAAEPRHLPPPCGLPETAVRALLRTAGFGDEASRLLDWWCDGGVLLLRQPEALGEARCMEFMFPYQAHTLRQRIGDGCLRDALTASLHLHGIEGGLGCNVWRLCRPQLHRLFRGCSQRMHSLIVAETVPTLQAADGARLPLNPRAVLRTVLAWSAQTGLDDFVLEADDEDPSIIHIDAWQCLAPAAGAIMRRGDDDAITAAVSAARSLAPANNPAENFAHAMVKARWGICALIGILTRAAQLTAPTEPPPHFKPRLLHLCTTAVLDTAAAVAAGTPIRCTDSFLAAYNGSTKARATEAPCPRDILNAGFSIVAHDSMDWLEAMMPLETKHVLGRPVLRRRVDACRAAVVGAGERPTTEL